MKTVDIVKELLEIANNNEWKREASGHRYCPYCKAKFDLHKEDCRYVEITKAAREYLKLMEGAKK